jgi:hypothetical protein
VPLAVAIRVGVGIRIHIVCGCLQRQAQVCVAAGSRLHSVERTLILALRGSFGHALVRFALQLLPVDTQQHRLRRATIRVSAVGTRAQRRSASRTPYSSMADQDPHSSPIRMPRTLNWPAQMWVITDARASEARAPRTHVVAEGHREAHGDRDQVVAEKVDHQAQCLPARRACGGVD